MFKYLQVQDALQFSQTVRRPLLHLPPHSRSLTTPLASTPAFPSPAWNPDALG